MDNDMERPQESAMFTSQLVGNGIGPVINGPFAGWLEDGGTMPIVRLFFDGEESYGNIF